MLKRAVKNERGIGLIEVLIALAVLGLIAAAFLGGLATSSKAVLSAQIRTTAESLARSQMEDVKNQPYDGTLPIVYDEILHDPDFPIDIAAERLNQDADPDDDDGIQKITVTVKYQDEIKITLEDYKVYR